MPWRSTDPLSESMIRRMVVHPSEVLEVHVQVMDHLNTVDLLTSVLARSRKSDRQLFGDRFRSEIDLGVTRFFDLRLHSEAATSSSGEGSGWSSRLSGPGVMHLDAVGRGLSLGQRPPSSSASFKQTKEKRFTSFWVSLCKVKCVSFLTVFDCCEWS
ncbi:hypothetical protein BU16DRAFT_625 [Lophium mytilinum]|uniref:Uncharacterized protein n=1 Tax=Lophium mytilinum TaxID=390894 RepID=A0A6A6RC76_9PEZI|nr:hypothetical protein BU16DRAFT_625 [Lophium mytilinum]